MLEGAGIEVGAQLVVQHQQHVPIELGGDALAVVVRRLDPRDVLAEIHAHAGTGRPAPSPRAPAPSSRMAAGG